MVKVRLLDLMEVPAAGISPAFSNKNPAAHAFVS